jgi:hypothetical protein
VAAQVFRRFGERIETVVDPSPGPPAADVRFTPATALLVRAEDAATTREVLARRLIRMREALVGPWVLFHFGPAEWRESYAMPSALGWAGVMPLSRGRKAGAIALVGRADADAAAQDPDAIGHLQLALRIHPDYHPALIRLERALQEQGRHAEGEAYAARRRALWVPESPAVISFENGIRFLGVTLSPVKARAGDSVSVRYFWEVPATTDTRRLTVSVRFTRDGTTYWRDNHVLLSDADVRPQMPGERFVEARTVRIPTDSVPAAYAIRLALIDTDRGGKRVRPRTELPVRQERVTLPVALEVQAGAPP